ncbi:MAG: hypothetical protein MUF58_08315 [Arcicella sp.]|nr:hypothetical protein [Arcicella sp.]
MNLQEFHQIPVFCHEMLKLKLQIFLLFFLLWSFGIKAQLNNTSLETFQFIDSTKSKQFTVQFESFSFLKNNEYFLKVADGYTLFGNQFSPKLIYQPAPHVRIEAGVYAWKDFGNNAFTAIQPIFSVKIQKDSSQFIFGNLEGHLNHRLIEPMLNFERVILNRQENGIQYTRRKSSTFFDSWIDWQRMIYKGSDFKEEFFAGFSWNKKLINRPKFSLAIPWQMTFQHRGGQTTKDTGQVITNINTAIGIEAQWFTNGLIKKVILQNYWVGYRQNANFHPYFPNGSAIYLNLAAESKWLNLMISYWKSSGYLSETGGDLYQSVGRTFRNGNVVEKERNLLIFRLMKDWRIIENLFLTVRFEPYFDLNNHEFEHSEGVFLTYRQNFRLR